MEINRRSGRGLQGPAEGRHGHRLPPRRFSLHPDLAAVRGAGLQGSPRR